jgi:hypothetical protein
MQLKDFLKKVRYITTLCAATLIGTDFIFWRRWNVPSLDAETVVWADD